MNGKIPHIVQYQGSKRILAPQILQHMPKKFFRLLEPFSGMAAISIAVACENRTDNFYINDLNQPLVHMLQAAIENPMELIAAYTSLWSEQFAYGENHAEHFYEVRDQFNNGNESPAHMLYLLARCVKGAVRYGKNGKFNQSPDKRRHGTKPQTLAANVYNVSSLLKGKTTFSALDYHDVLAVAKRGDVVYMDPPYQGVSNVRDKRYVSGISFDEFICAIEMLNRKGVDYIISYDGACGEKTYGQDLPRSLKCKKVMLNAGLSSQALLLGTKATTFEALYISESLIPLFKEIPHQLSLSEATYDLVSQRVS